MHNLKILRNLYTFILLVLFIIKNKKIRNRKTSKNIGILVTNWFDNAVPWYSITIGLLLEIRYNAKVNFIFSNYRNNCSAFNNILFSLLKNTKLIGNVITLNDYESNQFSKKCVYDLSKINIAHDTKCDSIIVDNNIYKSYLEYGKKVDAAVTNLYKTKNYDIIFVPNGLCNESGYFLQNKYLKTRISSFDSGANGCLLMCSNGIAAHLNDFRNINLDNFYSDKISYKVKKLINLRKKSKDAFNYQKSSVTRCDYDFKNSVFIPLNVCWDTASLGNNNLFNDTSEWLTKTIEYLLEHTDKNIFVRQHPMERHEYIKSNLDLNKILNIYSSYNRIFLINSNDNVNSYDILSNTDLCLVHSSSIALEAVIFNCPVICVSNCYYSGYNFINKPFSVENYYKLILKKLYHDQSIEDRKQALTLYYLTQELNWLFPFLAPTNLNNVLKSDSSYILKQKYTTEILSCVFDGNPIFEQTFEY